MNGQDLPEWILCPKCLKRAYLHAWGWRGKIIEYHYECQCGEGLEGEH